jgi:hypothetical protein
MQEVGGRKHTLKVRVFLPPAYSSCWGFFLAWGFRVGAAVFGGGMLDLSVDLSADQQREPSDVKPEH